MIQYQYFVASTWRRIVAYWIDQTVMAIFLLPLWIQVLRALILAEPLELSWGWLLAIFLLHLLYDWLFNFYLGGTLGKLFMGLRVVTAISHHELGLQQALVRALAERLSLFLGSGLRVLALLRFDRRHVSDWVAETQVCQRFDSGVFAPRVGLAILLSLYLSLVSLLSVAHLLSRTEWSRAGVKIQWDAGLKAM